MHVFYAADEVLIAIHNLLADPTAAAYTDREYRDLAIQLTALVRVFRERVEQYADNDT